jgi:hypothetical protein
MKRKTFLLLWLLLGIGFNLLSAQNGKNGTGAVVVKNIDWPGYWCPVYCNGVQVDLLTGNVTFHMEVTYKNGVATSANQQVHGEVTSSYPPYEVFKLNELDHVGHLSTVTKFHNNFVGNMGSHYIGFFIWDFTNDPNMENIISTKAVCPGENK